MSARIPLLIALVSTGLFTTSTLYGQQAGISSQLVFPQRSARSLPNRPAVQIKEVRAGVVVTEQVADHHDGCQSAEPIESANQC